MHCYWLQLQGALLVTSSTPRTIYMRPQCMSPMTLSCTYVCSRLVHAVQEKEVMQTKRSAADLSAIQADGKSRSVRMLVAYLDLGARYKMVGKQQRASAELRGPAHRDPGDPGRGKGTASPFLTLSQSYPVKQPVVCRSTSCSMSITGHFV